MEEAKTEYSLKRADYLMLKVKYYLVFRDLQKCRKFSYKLDLYVRENMDNDFWYRTEFHLLLTRGLCQHKEVLPSHY